MIVIFVSLDVPILQRRIIISILPTDRHEIILPSARTVKIKLPLPYMPFSEVSRYVTNDQTFLKTFLLYLVSLRTSFLLFI